MKKLLLIAALIGSFALSVKAELSASTNGGGTFVLLSSRAHASTIILTGTNTTTVYLYDMNTLAAPYFGTNTTNAAYTSKASYPTNIATSFVDYQGLTNWYTNTGTYTYLVTNAVGTNALTPIAVLSVGSGIPVVYTGDWLFSKGISVRSPSQTVGITVTYQP